MTDVRRRKVVRLPVYLFPVRIQQGWGDVREMANAAWAIARHAPVCDLLSLRVPAPRGRRDARAEPVDPAHAGPIEFPPVRSVTEPLGKGKAAIVATWWGTTGRTRDSQGGPLPGTIEPAVEAIRQAHGESSTLLVSLEEFASDQSSNTALDEGLRQAGWDASRRERQLSSETGGNERTLYHRAYELARDGDRDEVLHLVATLCPDPPALAEFPFLVPVGPYGMTRPRVKPRPAPLTGRLRVLWYASPPSSPDLARALFPALADLGRPVKASVRTTTDLRASLPPPTGSDLAVELVPAMDERAWRCAWVEAHLRIVAGSQSLVEAVGLGLPFLYFNGILQGPGEPPRAFRREKLLSLLSGLRDAGVGSQVLDDLENFADGRDIGAVVRRSLLARDWREEMMRGLRALPVGLPRERRDGGRFLAAVLESFAATPVSVVDFVQSVRASAELERGAPEPRRAGR